MLDCELAHDLTTHTALALSPILTLLASASPPPNEKLSVSLAGVALANPIGLAAGFDKNGILVPLLGQLGFGFAEIGSVTANACPGNPKPRLFRLPEDKALINRLGLNGQGASLVARRISRQRLSLPIGVNIAKTNDPTLHGDAAVSDILRAYAQIKDLPISYLTINASCPNTAEGIMVESGMIGTILCEIAKDNKRALPGLIKLSPDSPGSFVEEIVALATKYGIAGYVCGNTTASRTGLKTSQSMVSRLGAGGLSGKPLKPLALALTKRVAQLKGKDQIIIACGGVSSGQDAYEFIGQGATAVQIYTALVYQGPGLPRRINQELSALLEADGLTMKEAVGSRLI